MNLAERLRGELRLDRVAERAQFPTADSVLAVATEHFLAGRRIDVQQLAAEVGVGRATVYRWFGDRERLVGQVLWGVSRQALEWFAAQGRDDDVEHVLGTIEAFMRVTSEFGPLRQFLGAEPALALRALLEPDAHVVVSLNGWVADGLAAAGFGLDQDGPSARELAEVLVSVTSTYCWARIIAGGEADVESAMRAVRVLLRVSTPSMIRP
ncbi:MAG: QsdR family transcriptional regulator [Propionibacteriales bacterium]|nr:QsdR family transcriptional regulator [Propionibacteriales bacterium]